MDGRGRTLSEMRGWPRSWRKLEVRLVWASTGVGDIVREVQEDPGEGLWRWEIRALGLF